MTAVEVRQNLVDALRLDLIGPGERIGADGTTLGEPNESLSQSPSAWYLTGFLIPTEAEPEQRIDEQAADDFDSAAGEAGLDDDVTPEPAAARVRYLPSSIGISLLVPAEARELSVAVRWGDYRVRKVEVPDGAPRFEWDRTPRQATVTLPIPEPTGRASETAIPKSSGLQLSTLARTVPVVHEEGGLPAGTRSVSLFLVNRRTPEPDNVRDQAFAFQAQIEVHGDAAFVPRPNLRSLGSDDWDERVADLQYRDAFEYSVGHNVATEAVLDGDGDCREVRTQWIPLAEVERVAPSRVDVERSMDALGQLPDGATAHEKLDSLVASYETWIETQRSAAPESPLRRSEVAAELLSRASHAARRIGEGIDLLSDPVVLEAFRIANRAMAAAARQRFGPDSTPEWRPFQLAFLLMNLKGIVDPTHADREAVDLLFFPTGGGKTEAYLGLAAFTLVLRRLRNPGIASAGLTVLMRYTLRLLTLDQLGRGAALICALELERQRDVEKLGDWPFEIGLWVGQAATPNRMGSKEDRNGHTAREKTIAFQRKTSNASPIPLEDCPWCGTKFERTSFRLMPGPDEPSDLRITCANRRCAFTRDNPLPIVAVDEPIYRRLPCFLIATVDKFAAMPWTGEVGQFFGRVQRYDREGFYGPCFPLRGDPLPVDRLPPPELIVQDELHLISGPLGTVAGLYETALEELSTVDVGDRRIGPKIVASTATVRRAEQQIRRLFARRTVDVFPPPGPDRRDSFFAHTEPPSETPARQYVGVAAQGRSPKVVMLRVYLALLAAAQRAWTANGGTKNADNPADPYMTLLGYFNSLRELGGARRVVEDEVGVRLGGYGRRKRVAETEGLFADRRIKHEPVELTSRVATNDVAEAKRQLGLPFVEDEHVDVALATNMISVGLDITRLGLMVAFGQPKTSSEYIQATSRVGRDPSRPGLVVTILNVHKPRDRSHYERFGAYHETFYRVVEATSVTPFSPRALDRALAATIVALARQGHQPMTVPFGAAAILEERSNLDWTIRVLRERASECGTEPERDAERVEGRSMDLLDEWSRIALGLHEVGGQLQYQREAPGAERLLYEFLNPELKTKTQRHKKFRANRSMRDVEPSVNLWLKTIDGIDVEEDAS